MVSFKSNWLAQQHQQLTLREGVNSISKEIATCESKAGVRDETANATEVEMAAGNSRRTVSTSIGAFSNNEANTQEIERVKNG